LVDFVANFAWQIAESEGLRFEGFGNGGRIDRLVECDAMPDMVAVVMSNGEDSKHFFGQGGVTRTRHASTISIRWLI
jgi:hypothetical protein